MIEIKEGYEKKGGVNKAPTTPKPKLDPPGQGTVVSCCTATANYYKDIIRKREGQLRKLCEGLEVENIEDFLEKDPELFFLTGKYIKDRFKEVLAKNFEKYS